MIIFVYQKKDDMDVYKLDDKTVCTVTYLKAQHAYKYDVDNLPIATFSEFMVSKFGTMPFVYLCESLVTMSKEEMLNLKIG